MKLRPSIKMPLHAATQLATKHYSRYAKASVFIPFIRGIEKV